MWGFFSAPDPTGALLGAAASHAAQAGSLLQLTWCLPHIQQLKLKLALAFKVYSNPFNSSALCEKQMGNIKAYSSSCNSQSGWESCNKFTVRKRTVCKLSLCSKTVYYQKIILGDSCCWDILCFFKNYYYFLVIQHNSWADTQTSEIGSSFLFNSTSCHFGREMAW